MNIRTENWNGHEIRFVEKEPGEWWAVAKDVAEALGYRTAPDMTRCLEKEDIATLSMRSRNWEQELQVVSESGIYDAILTAAKT